MNFYELDLKQILPYGIPVNSDSHVEPIDYINEFFLRGFKSWFAGLYEVDDPDLIRDYSRSCTAPNSIAACSFCTDDQLKDMITEAGFIYYPGNSHETNAKFLYDINHVPYGTENYLSILAQYIADDPDVSAEIIYDDHAPYTYSIRFYGDISGSTNVNTMTTRMLEHLTILGTAHTICTDFQYEDSDTEMHAYAACVGDDVCNNIDVTLGIPVDKSVLKSYFESTTNRRNLNTSTIYIRGTSAVPYTYTTSISGSTTSITLPIYFNVDKYGSYRYPWLGYSTMELKPIAGKTWKYIVNEQSFPLHYTSGTPRAVSTYISENLMNRLYLSDIKLECLYSNLGVRQQVFSVKNAGFKRYIDAVDLMNDNVIPAFEEQGLNSFGYYKDQHFYAYLTPTGVRLELFGGADPNYPLMYSNSLGDASYAFLYDDAYDYVVDAIYGYEIADTTPSLGETDRYTFLIEEDYNGDPLDLSNFSFSHTPSGVGGHKLELHCSQEVENAVFVQFHLVPKSNRIEGWSTDNARQTSVNSSGTYYSLCLKCFGSEVQPGGAAGTSLSDYGTDPSPVALYICSDSNFDPRFFRNVTEAQAFLSAIGSTTKFTHWDQSLQSKLVGNRYAIYGPTLNRVCFSVMEFDAVNTADVVLSWINPRKNRYKEIEITDDLAFGISKKYDGCKLYIVDEVNHDSSKASKLTSEVVFNPDNKDYHIKFKYISDDPLEAITHIKVHPAFHQE